MYNVKGEIIMTREANPIPQGKYVPATRFGNMIFTAGMTPRNNGVLLKTGKIKATDEIADYKEAVVQAAKNALTAAKNKLENGEKIVQIMQITVYVNSQRLQILHRSISVKNSENLESEAGLRLGLQFFRGTHRLKYLLLLELKIKN